ncbi:MAG: type III-B CRISPR-associated protein Cas10/Cmr2 [Cyanobacterium sp.]
MPQYTVITFAPVQGFIEKSRKLRDLYGSSYILSLLSWVVCQRVEKLGYKVISPASTNVTQGMPNQIVVKGELPQGEIIRIKCTLDEAWKCLVYGCKEWIEEKITVIGPESEYYKYWRRDWQLWVNYCWEFFSASGDTITQARNNLNQAKNSRDWTGINWQGESSTLSGSDAICQPLLGEPYEPHSYNYQQEKKIIRNFYKALSESLGEAFIDPSEELSIPELVKRIITHETIINRVANKLEFLNLDLSSEKIRKLSEELSPNSFRDLNRHQEDNNESKSWTGWFLGDGDNASKYFKSLAKQNPQTEEKGLIQFSAKMREWGNNFKENENDLLEGKGRMIYAGGDDFLGVLYDKPFFTDDNQAKLSAYDCLKWFYSFKSGVWHGDKPKIITASVGFVWAGNQVPQRDILQHCHLAESSAKSTGRDRIAFRILFNSGNYLEWVCPWWLLDTGEWIFEVENQSSRVCLPEDLRVDLEGLKKANLNLIESYGDRTKKLLKNGGNWTHFYQDIATLESRHAFNKKVFSEEELARNNTIINNDIALSLINIYFGEKWHKIISNSNYWFNRYDDDELLTFTGILGDPKQFIPDYTPQQYKQLIKHPLVKQALNNWVVNLGKIGFYLTDQ